MPYFIQFRLQDVVRVLGLLELLREFALHLSGLLVQCLEAALLTREFLKSKTQQTDGG